MKKFKISIAWLSVLALTFTSCSKEEADPVSVDEEKIQVTFGSLLNDFNNQNKQAEPGECIDGTPGYVLVGITEGDNSNSTTYIDDGDPNDGDNLIKINLKNNSGHWETEYSELLALPAGDYHLQHFIIYTNDGKVLWVAPRTDGTFGTYVDHPLPQLIVLTAGTKPYIPVDVLCYVARSEEAYGYPFFDLDLIEVKNSYCIFVNYCYDQTGREYPAYFSVDIWSDAYDGTEVVYSDRMNSVSNANGNPATTVLCLALPDLGDDTYYARVTIVNHALLPYVSDPEADYFEFTFTQDDINDQELMVPAYQHVRFNCQPPSGEPTCEPGTVVGDTNGDCIVDCKDTGSCEPGDPCPGVDPELDVNNDCVIDCLDTNSCGEETPGCDDTAFVYGGVELNELGLYSGNNWGWGLVIGDDTDGFDESLYWNPENDRYEFPFIAGAGQNQEEKGWEAGLILVTIENGWLHVNFKLDEGVSMTESHIWFSESVGDEQWPSSRAHGQYDKGEYSFMLNDPTGNGVYSLIVHSGGVSHESCNND